ncbi:unnamed protein product [Rangifer tarandus platyrhynchus]|uniref:Uncharacterized protein n=1 Tax=Rangifer tarandus platyrhynchus TaxID=3082113 RepID=A0AC59ZWD3_RANTA
MDSGRVHVSLAPHPRSAEHGWLSTQDVGRRSLGAPAGHWGPGPVHVHPRWPRGSQDRAWLHPRRRVTVLCGVISPSLGRPPQSGGLAVTAQELLGVTSQEEGAWYWVVSSPERQGPLRLRRQWRGLT